MVRKHALAAWLLQPFTASLLQPFAVDTSRQRIDAPTVRSAVRTLTRFGMVVETGGKCLRE